MEDIKMTDQKAQYAQHKPELDAAFSAAMERMMQENSPLVDDFASKVAGYLGARHVFPCANGTDALQIALAALDLPAGAEVIMPAFGDAAGAEAVKLLGLKPVFADVLPDTYMLDPAAVEKAATPGTVAIMPVHLFGHCAPMHELLSLAARHSLFVVEDNTQSLGAVYVGPEGQEAKAGSLGHISATAFFPAKPLAGTGEGGAVITSDAALAENIGRITRNEQQEGAEPERLYIKSPLDPLQAAMQEVKLKYIESYNSARREVAHFYDKAFAETVLVQAPHRAPYSSHTYQQYTITVNPKLRDGLQEHLRRQHIPSVVYYPQPLHLQEPFAYLGYKAGDFPVSERLSESVLSLPMHPRLKEDQLAYICQHLLNYVKQHD
ncbi:DegT/DnrJ/EryC1/StrS family aminotransferase [Pontibacter russatus]|uniref:DegT/DnrJ/EryC1/StrS family aminotransferase n=1 Tax=Pontibacter russatus TaxID=2694929 RepID=UPI00137A7699|nr:DegT/DnrJ/EryC1/StrS family aminotransferase [Pontibacter russatus]